MTTSPHQRVRVVAAVIQRADNFLVCQRPLHKRHGGLWEFPGGKVEPGEDDLSALRRELREELAVEVVAVGGELFRSDDDGSIFTIAFIPTTIVGDPQAIEHPTIAWMGRDMLRTVELAPSDRRFVQHVLEQ